jgi:hypothetical protein
MLRGMGWLEELHGTLDKRAMPEAVAGIMQDNAPDLGLPAATLLELRRVASARSPWQVSSMSDDFERVPDCRDQLEAAGRLCGVDISDVDPADPEQIRDLIDAQGFMLGGWRSGADWKTGRLNGEQRAGFRNRLAVPHPALSSKRQYNRCIRALRHLDGKRTRMLRGQQLRRLVLTGRSGFACDIPFERFAADPVAACFIAYYTARKNRRRLFTLAAKENPVDYLAQGLLRQCERDPGTDWEMIAWVHPQPEILGRLTDEQRGALMGRWRAVMRDAACELEQAWPAGVNKLSMIVRRGMDSSTWNTMASAYNAARAGWLNCVTASGASAMLEASCPGKVMRLMAADLAAWHRYSGGDVDPDTKVWAFLPMPWDVISGAAACTRADVEGACREMGVDAEARGWTAPRAGGAVAVFTPTPDLVHGVEVADPQWAALLRHAGVFSGKTIRPDMAPLVAAVPAGVVTGALPAYDHDGAYAGPVADGKLDGTA